MDLRKMKPMAGLIAFADALLPEMPELAAKAREAGREDEAVFYETKGSYSPHLLAEVHGAKADDLGGEFVESAVAGQMIDTVENKIHPDLGTAFVMFLWTLQSRFLSVLLCGTKVFSTKYPFMLSFVEMPLKTRQKILLEWATSSIPTMTAIFRGIKGVIMGNILSKPNKTGENVLWKALDYPYPSESRKVKARPEAIENEQIIQSGLVSLENPSANGNQTANVQNELAAKGIKIERGNDEVTVVCDAVVIGSGAGGGTAAALLSDAGLKVLIIEKGQFVPISQMSLVEGEAFANLYEQYGVKTSSDAGVSILAGSTLGGGTRVNWCASLRTPSHVLKEWSEAPHSLPAFSSDKFMSSMDAVCKRLGVHQEFQQDTLGGTMKASYDALGYHTDVMPINCKSRVCSSMCTFGCVHGDKQDGVQTYLKDAVQSGARIITGCTADSLITEQNDQPGKPKIVKGVQCTVNLGEGKKVKIILKAGMVIASCGSINTPALLLRSGITCSGNVGKHLRLHPAQVVMGVFPENPEKKNGVVRGWEGAMMSFYSTEAANWYSEGSNYGPLLSAPAVHPGLFGATVPWYSAEEYKRMILNMKNSLIPLLYTRDEDSGSITINKEGSPVVNYWPSERDVHKMINGLILCLRGLRKAGVEQIWTSNFDYKQAIGGFDSEHQIDDDEFEDLLKEVEKRGIQKLRVPVFSAHQMGSCRMGSNPEEAAADANGETWEVAGLYICDASVMPTASGVNPMITTQSIAHMNACGIVERLQKNPRKHISVAQE